MLSASMPSCAATSTATGRMPSRERPLGSVVRRLATVPCIVRRTVTWRFGEAVVSGRSTARAMVWCAFAGQALFVAAWVAAGAVQPGYSGVSQPVSALAAHDAAHPWIVMAGIALFGLSLVALAG